MYKNLEEHNRLVNKYLKIFFVVALYWQRTSFKCMLCCGAIVVGFWLGVDQESLTEVFSWRGTVYGVLSSLALAMYSIQTKKSLSYVNQEVWLLSYYNNLYSTILFLPLIILNGELETIITYPHMWAAWFWAAMTLSGICGFAIGFVTALEIQVTSALTHNISGTAKACAQTVIATQYYRDVRSALWWTSNIVVLLASAAYTRVKQLEMLRHHQQRNAAPQKA
ncbi:GDP-fucose transporter 1 isoform X2 [Drosophila tropicalis]|uniref:GDP-fucose transporter 1 isoform X2 n=1 Tax=Drosophila tropicalis TaxID=46794 RepID=UPI0035AC200F